MRTIAVSLIIVFLLTLSSCGPSPHRVGTGNLKDEAGHYVYNGIAWGSSKEETEEKLGFKLTAEPMAGQIAESGLESLTYDQLNCAEIVINGKTYKGGARVWFEGGLLTGIGFFFTMPAGESADALHALAADLTAKYGEPREQPDVEPMIEIPGREAYGWMRFEDSVFTSLSAGKHTQRDDESREIVGLVLGFHHRVSE